jgi:hypothetical protein
MQQLKCEEIGGRRVRLLEKDNERFAVVIEVYGDATWHDISFWSDARLAFDIATRRYRERVVEQQARLSAARWVRR